MGRYAHVRQRRIIDLGTDPLAQPFDPFYAAVPTHRAADGEIFCGLLPEVKILAQPAQQQFGFVVRQLTIHESRNLCFYRIVHTFLPLLSNQRPDFFAYRIPGPENSRPHGTNRTVHCFRNLLVTHAIQFAQNDRGSQIIGQRVNSLFERLL